MNAHKRCQNHNAHWELRQGDLVSGWYENRMKAETDNVPGGAQ